MLACTRRGEDGEYYTTKGFLGGGKWGLNEVRMGGS